MSSLTLTLLCSASGGYLQLPEQRYPTKYNLMQTGICGKEKEDEEGER